MFSDFKKSFGDGFAAALMVLPALVKADSDYTPTQYGGNSVWGWNLASRVPGARPGKLWLDRDNALQPAVKF